MLAAVVEKPGQLVVKEVDKPKPGPQQFLIKTLASSICNATDNHIVEGIFDGYHDHYPQILGHEVCGEVVELGSEVTDVKIGERIAMYTPYGAFAEYVPVDRWGYGFARVPDGVSNEVASICEMFDGSFRSTIACASIQPGEKVLVIGCGPMGLTATACAKMYGAEITCVDLYQNRLDKALEMGASHVFNRSKMSAQEIIDAIGTEVGEMDTAFMCIALDRSEENDAFYIPIEVLKENGKPQCVHRRKPVPSRGHSETECRRESLNVAHYLFLPGRSGRRRIGYDFIKLGNIAFLMSHVNIHLWCRGSPERGIPTLPSWPGAVLRRSPSSVLPLRHPADYGNSTHSVCPGMCSRSCVPMRMCPQKHMR